MVTVTDWRRIVFDVLAVVAVNAALWYAVGPFGVIIGGIITITSALTSPVYAFAVGQILFVVLTTTVAGELPRESLLVAQAGLASLLFAAVVGRWPLRPATVTAVAFAIAAVGFASVYALETLWHAAAVLAVAYAITAYTVHRYELVRLGLVTEADR